MEEEIRSAAANKTVEQDRGGDFAGRFEVQVRLAGIDREAVNLGGCQWGGGLAVVASVMKELGPRGSRRSA